MVYDYPIGAMRVLVGIDVIYILVAHAAVLKRRRSHEGKVCILLARQSTRAVA